MSSSDPIRWLHLDERARQRLRSSAPRLLASRPWVKALYLYGSAARGQRPARDLDLGIVADPVPASGCEELEIAAAFAAELSIPVEALDVRILNGGDPVFLGNVLADAELVFEHDREARIAFEVRAMSLWLDFRPRWERMRKRVLAKWADD